MIRSGPCGEEMPKDFKVRSFHLPSFSHWFLQTHSTTADSCTLILRYAKVCSVSRGSLSNFHTFPCMRCAGVLSGTQKLVPYVNKRLSLIVPFESFSKQTHPS